MDEQYRVVFEECGGFVGGALAAGRQLARDLFALEYLLSVGAIVAVAADPAAGPDGSDVPDKSEVSDKMGEGRGAARLRSGRAARSAGSTVTVKEISHG